MKLGSVRLGFANNSSSSHSILVGAVPSDHGPQDASHNDYVCFGEGYFRQSTPEEKRLYLGSQFSNFLRDKYGGLPEAAVAAICNTVFGLPADAGVDEEAEWAFPAKWPNWPEEKGPFPDEEFAKAFIDFVVNSPDVCIMGGSRNDNQDDYYPQYRRRIKLPTNSWGPFPRTVCRDEGNGWWTFFNRFDGTKFRILLSSDDVPEPELKTPELVDLKITNQCSGGCEFCYQGSTPDGAHAPYQGERKDINSIVRMLRRAKVFEVAIGGGEPTDHPDFDRIVCELDERGIMANFTTADLSWMDHDVVADAVFEHAGSFAVSLLDEVSIVKVREWNKNVFSKPDRGGPFGVRGIGVIQIPLGCYPEDEIVKAIEYCKRHYVQYTLLGFKESGRGRSFTPFPYGEKLFEAVGAERDVYFLFGADSVFVEKHADFLDSIDADERLRVVREGIESCYIDAVDWTISRASFGASPRFPINESDLFEHFPFAKTDLFM